MSHILAIGIATIDIINIVADYPSENDEIRALSQQIRRGGNATNTLVILSQLGHQCSWGGVWVDEPDAQIVLADLARYHIDIQQCHRLTTGKMPTSYITLNQTNGSRMIIHYRDLPEFSAVNFQQIDLSNVDWLHFEGRQVTETMSMLQRSKRLFPHLPISIEIEKPRPDITQLFAYADVLLFSKNYAHSQGYKNPQLFLTAMREYTQQAQLICAWGEEGGYALSQDNQFYYSPALSGKIVDTLGAGDTFNAGIIHALCQQQKLTQALETACQLAGYKCTHYGLIV